MIKKVWQHDTRAKDQLKADVKEWEKIDSQVTRNRVNSMKNGINDLISNKEGLTSC